MTNFIRTITDHNKADNARYEAHEEFIAQLQAHDLTHLVTEEAFVRWFHPRVRRNLATKIAEDHGPAVSTRLDRSKR